MNLSTLSSISAFPILCISINMQRMFASEKQTRCFEMSCTNYAANISRTTCTNQIIRPKSFWHGVSFF